MTTPKQHGGPRKGAGRKKGNGKGRISVTRSVSMHPDSWETLDSLRGSQSRGKFIEGKLK